MSIDRSLKSASSLSRHRNVLTRVERLAILEDEGRWEQDKDAVYGLPKVGHRKVATKKKKAAGPADETEEATE